MASRFQKLYSLTPNQYIEGCPVLIEAGALQKDTESGAILAQIKMQNIGEKPIESCKISLKAYENNGDEIEGVSDFSYLDLNAEPGMTFGGKTPVLFPNETTRSYSVIIKEIVFADKTVATYTQVVWKTVPQFKLLNTLLTDSEVEKQYDIEVGGNCKYVPERHEGLFLCTCGGINNSTNSCCCKCGRSFETLTVALNASDLEKKTSNRLDAEQAAREAKAKKKEENAKKAKKIVAITVPIIVVVIATVLLLTQIVIPSNKYKKALSLVDDGSYGFAESIFYELGDYKDSENYSTYCYLQDRLSGDIEGENLSEIYSYAKSLDGFDKVPNLIEENEYLRQIAKIDSKKWNCVKKKNLLYGFYDEEDDRKYSYSAYVNDAKNFVLVQNLTYSFDSEDSYDNESEFYFILENGKLTIDLIHTDYVIRDKIEFIGSQLRVETSETSSWQDDAYMIFE